MPSPASSLRTPGPGASCCTRPVRGSRTLAGPRPNGADGLLAALLVRDSGEQGAHLAFPVAAVAAERPDRGELAGLRPPRDRLRVDAERRRDLGGGEQRLAVGSASGHVENLQTRDQGGGASPDHRVAYPAMSDMAQGSHLRGASAR